MLDGNNNYLCPQNLDINLGPCVIASQGGVEFDCAPDGNFEPLQCQPVVGDLLRCVCVNPSDGALIENTEVIVASRDDAPDCDRLGE